MEKVNKQRLGKEFSDRRLIQLIDRHELSDRCLCQAFHLFLIKKVFHVMAKLDGFRVIGIPPDVSV
jgi:hypothetical protein